MRKNVVENKYKRRMKRIALIAVALLAVLFGASAAAFAEEDAEEAKSFETLEAPVPSNFRVSAREIDGVTSATVDVYVAFPDSVYEALNYATEEMSLSDPFTLVTEVRSEGEEWEEISLNDPKEIRDGYRAATLSGPTLSPRKNTECRARVVCWALNITSDWSNVVNSYGTGDLLPSEEETEAEETEPGVEKAGEAGNEKTCPVCHFCPQPLGLCLFLWILIAVLVAVVVFLVIRAVTKKKKQEEQKS